MINEKYNIPLHCGIHTLSIISDTLVLNNIEGVETLKTYVNRTGEISYSTFINPNRFKNKEIYNFTEFNEVFSEIKQITGINDYLLSRVDLRFDSYDDNFNELYKMNKLVVLLASIAYNLNNRYESIDPLTLDKLTIRVQSEYYEVENYNKAIQSNYNDQAQNRLEFRSKALSKTNKDISEVIQNWNKKLDLLQTEYIYLQRLCNNILVRQWGKENTLSVKDFSEFARKYQDIIYTSEQLKNLLIILNKSGTPSSVYKFKERNNIEYITPKDLQAYINNIKDSLNKFVTDKDIKQKEQAKINPYFVQVQEILINNNALNIHAKQII